LASKIAGFDSEIRVISDSFSIKWYL